MNPRLVQLTHDLIRAHKELGMLLAQEHRAKIETWVRSEATTIAARDREADAAALEITCAIHELRGQIKALELERELELMQPCDCREEQGA